MKNSIIFYFILMSTMCFGQLDWEWAYDIDHEGNDYIKEFALDQDGNIFALVDFFNGNLIIENDTMMPPASGFRPSFLLKMDNDGNLIWVRQITTNDKIFCIDVCVDNENNVYVGGTYRGVIHVNDTVLSSLNYSIFIAKYNNDGNVLDVFNYPDIGSAGISAMCLNSSNEIFITGNYFADFTISGFDLTYNSVNPGRTDTYIAKIDTDGIIQWVNCISGDGADSPKDISCDKTNNIYLLGRFSSSEIMIGDFTLYSNVLDLTLHDIFIVRYNTEGDVIWAEKLGDEEDDSGNSISVDFENNISVAGEFSGNTFVFNDTILDGGCPCLNSFLVKFDSTYNTIWGFSFGYQGNNESCCARTDFSGNTYLLGNFAGEIDLDGFNITALGATEIYVTRLNVLGEITGLYSAGGELHDVPTNIEIDPNGDCIITGHFYSSIMEFGDINIYNDSDVNADFFVAKLSSSTVTNIVNNKIGLSIFPNPTSQSFTINTEKLPAKVEIYDINGRLIKSINEYNGKRIDVSNFAKGIYFVKLVNDKQSSIGKLVVE